MQILKAVVEPLIEQALAQVGITNDHWRSMLAPSRELDQGDLSLPCFPFHFGLSASRPSRVASTSSWLRCFNAQARTPTCFPISST